MINRSNFSFSLKFLSLFCLFFMSSGLHADEIAKLLADVFCVPKSEWISSFIPAEEEGVCLDTTFRSMFKPNPEYKEELIKILMALKKEAGGRSIDPSPEGRRPNDYKTRTNLPDAFHYNSRYEYWLLKEFEKYEVLFHRFYFELLELLRFQRFLKLHAEPRQRLFESLPNFLDRLGLFMDIFPGETCKAARSYSGVIDDESFKIPKDAFLIKIHIKECDFKVEQLELSLMIHKRYDNKVSGSVESLRVEDNYFSVIDRKYYFPENCSPHGYYFFKTLINVVSRIQETGLNVLQEFSNVRRATSIMEKFSRQGLIRTVWCSTPSF